MLWKDYDSLVLYAPISDDTQISTLYPDVRAAEVFGCKNDKSRREKYCVWKLLERAVRDYLLLDFDNLHFTKNDYGKWECPDFEFSLSHTDRLVCVAISTTPIGVDVELVRTLKQRLSSRILTPIETERFNTLDDDKKSEYLLECWVRKESIFKRNGQAALMPNRIETDLYRTRVEHLHVCERDYVMSVSSHGEKILFKYMEEI